MSETTNDYAPERDDDPNPLNIAFAALPGIHEGGVHGSVLAQTRSLVEEYIRPEPVEIVDPITGTTALAVVTHQGLKPIPASYFDDYLAYPRQRDGTAVLTSLDSFIAHVNRFRSDESIVFGVDERTSPSLTAVLDYHPRGADTAPDFSRHRSHFAFPLSDEWKAWLGQNGKSMSMIDFAQFLEDRVIDVLHPDGAELTGDTLRFIETLGGSGRIATPTKLVELSRGLQVFENSAIREAHKLSSGEGQVSFVTEHTDANGEALIIPTMFLLAIPVFRNGPPYQVVARLRYRTRPQLTFSYELWRIDRVFDHAFSEACERVKAETGLPLLLGKPE